MSRNPLTVELISWTQWPLGTLFYVWEQSRSNDRLPRPSGIERFLFDYTHDEHESSHHESEVGVDVLGDWIDKGIDDIALALGAEQRGKRIVGQIAARRRVMSVIEQIVNEDIPVTENIYFTFHIKNISISLREQLVRHRIGNHVGPNFGVDIVPDLAESTWWSQTSRVVRQDTFADEGRYITPDSIHKNIVDGGRHGISVNDCGERAVTTVASAYENLMRECQETYKDLILAGVPVEDARQVLPLAATHDITWTVNLKALSHILGKRSCWVAQIGMWEPLITGMVDEMCEKVNPIFRRLISPPCMSRSGEYKSCPFAHINAERIAGRDGMPPCPLFVYNQTSEAVATALDNPPSAWMPKTLHPADGAANEDIRTWHCNDAGQVEMLNVNAAKFERLWRLDMTGKPSG